MPQSHERINYLDYAKGVGILLVVIGHVFTYGMTAKFIFLFHMPLFFVLAGITHRPQPCLRFLLKTTLSLALPYVAYLVFISSSQLYDVFTARFSVDLWAAFSAVGSVLARKAYGGIALVKEFGVFWFVSVLFLSLNALNALLYWKGSNRRTLQISLIVCLILGTLDDNLVQPEAFPLNVNVVPAALVFMLVGYLGKSCFLEPRRYILIGSIALVTISAILLVIEPQLAVVVMKKANYGVPVVGFLFSLSWVYLLLYLCFQLTNRKVFSRLLIALGSASLVIMFLHQPIHFFLAEIDLPLHRALIAAVAVVTSYGFYGLANESRVLRQIFIGKK